MTTEPLLQPEATVGPEPLAPRVIGVEAAPEACVRVTFETGETRTVDVSPLLGRGVFRPLAEAEAFGRVSVVEGGMGIEWSSGADLSANRLYFGAK